MKGQTFTLRVMLFIIKTIDCLPTWYTHDICYLIYDVSNNKLLYVCHVRRLSVLFTMNNIVLTLLATVVIFWINFPSFSEILIWSPEI